LIFINSPKVSIFFGKTLEDDKKEIAEQEKRNDMVYAHVLGNKELLDKILTDNFIKNRIFSMIFSPDFTHNYGSLFTPEFRAIIAEYLKK
jgi:hypothetical protein